MGRPHESICERALLKSLVFISSCSLVVRVDLNIVQIQVLCREWRHRYDPRHMHTCAMDDDACALVQNRSPLASEWAGGKTLWFKSVTGFRNVRLPKICVVYYYDRVIGKLSYFVWETCSCFMQYLVMIVSSI